MITRRLAITTGALVLAIAAPRPSHAHSFPASENPSAGQTLATSPPTVAITYDAPIEKLFASLEVDNSAGVNQAAAPPQVSPDGSTLSVPVAHLAPGDYTVKWRVVCVDTHHTEGSYSFTVAGGTR
jgi:methionine-rich copper-binding protein CopC